MAGGFDDYEEEDDDDEVISADSDSNDDSEGDGEGGGRKRRRRRRRRRGRGGADENGSAESTETPLEPAAPAEPIRVHELAKELDVKSREILDAVAERLSELELKGAMSWIPAEHVATVRSFLAPEPTPAVEDAEATEVDADADPHEGASAAAAETTDGEDGPRKKRRRRRRRGGRKHRRDENHDATDGSDDSSVDDASDSSASAADAGDPEPDELEPVTVNGSDDDESMTPVVETTAPPTPKPRRSLYGGRHQRLSTPPEPSNDR
jgi:ribonuclease E